MANLLTAFHPGHVAYNKPNFYVASMLDFLVAMGFRDRLDSRSYTSFFTLNNVFVHDGFFVFYYI